MRKTVDPCLVNLDAQWARRWHRQVDEFFEVRCTAMPERPLDDRCLAALIGNSEPFEVLWPDAANVRSLAAYIPPSDSPGYDQRSSGRWQAQLEASARLMEAQRAIRHVPGIRESNPSPPKCSLLGSFEQLGPDGLGDGRRFWESARENLNVRGARLRKGERFSAIAMCKRFAAPATLASELELDAEDFRFPDTATIAASDWLSRADIETNEIRKNYRDWNGRWLHQASRTSVDEGEDPPPQPVWDQIVSKGKELGRPPS